MSEDMREWIKSEQAAWCAVSMEQAKNKKLEAENAKLLDRLNRVDAYLTMHPGEPEPAIIGALQIIRESPSSACEVKDE